MSIPEYISCNDWYNSLKAGGYRLTQPRRLIVQIIATSSRALSPMDVYAIGRQQNHLGLVTVYRTLDKLEELGLVQRMHQPNGCHMYLRSSQKHEHLLLCVACGRSEYFSGDDLSELIENIAQRSGYKFHDHGLQLNGLCIDCQQGRKISK